MNKTIYINGYWKDNKEKFNNYKCVVSKCKNNKNDEDIFFYFENLKDVKDYMTNKNDFTITNFYKGE